MPYRSISLSEKELEMVLLIRQLVTLAGRRDTDILVQKRGDYLRVCGVGMPERLVDTLPNLTQATAVK
jgi:tetraacyldisaccharide-1-P 4'-kinase